MVTNYQQPEVTVLEIGFQEVLCTSGNGTRTEPVTDDDSNLFEWD